MKLITIIFSVLAIAALQDNRGQTKDPREIETPPLRDFRPQNPERIELDNGIVLYLLEDHEFPFINISAIFKGGSLADPEDKTGLAGIAAEVMRTGGTKNSSEDEINEELESIGAGVVFGLSDESINGSASSLSRDIDTLLTRFSDIILNPVFSEDAIERAKVSRRSSIARRNDDPFGIAYRKFNEVIYGKGHPLARTIELETISAITMEDLQKFHDTYIRPNNLILGITGDFERDEIIKKLEITFSGWEAAEIPHLELKPAEITEKPSINYVEKKDVTQSVVMMGHIGIRMDHPDYFALSVANSILSGFSGRMFSNVRSKKGLAYTVRASTGAGWYHPGIFNAMCSTKAETTLTAIQAIKEELEKIATDLVTDEELQLAKDSILNSMVFQFDTKLKILARQMRYEFYGYPRDFINRYKNAVQNITKEEILEAVKKNYHLDKLSILVVGNKENFERPLETLGEVRALELEKPAKEVTIKTTEQSIQKGRKIFSLMIEKIGSKDELLSINSLRMEMDVTMESSPMGEMAVTATFVFPDQMRLDIKTSMGIMTQVVSKDKGWMSIGGRLQEAQPSQVAQMKESITKNLLYTLKSLAASEQVPVHSPGEKTIGETTAIILEVTEGDYSGTKLYVSADSSKILRVERPSADGSEGALEISGYKTFGQLTIPSQYTQTTPRGKTETEIKSLEINPQVEQTMFQAPK